MGSYDSSTIEIVAEKMTTSSSGVIRDRLFIRYKVMNDAFELVNTLALPIDSPKVISGKYFDEQGNYQMIYIYNLDCGQEGTVYIKLSANPNEMHFGLLPQGIVNEDLCPNARQILPTTGITLTKQ